MSSYRQILYHSVINTKDRKLTIPEPHCQTLYRYIWGIVKNTDSTLYQINGIGNHIHLLTDLNPTISLSDFIKNIKVASSMWMRQQKNFPLWESWGKGYGSFTCSYNEKDRLISYIKNQKSHHQKESFVDEYKRLLIENGVEFDKRYLLG